MNQSTAELEHELAETGWRIFRGELSPTKGEAIRNGIKMELFRRNPHHRCDTCHKPLSAINGPRCAACIDLTLRRPQPNQPEPVTA